MSLENEILELTAEQQEALNERELQAQQELLGSMQTEMAEAQARGDMETANYYKAQIEAFTEKIEVSDTAKTSKKEDASESEELNKKGEEKLGSSCGAFCQKTNTNSSMGNYLSYS